MELLCLISGISVGTLVGVVADQYWHANDRCKFMADVLKRQDEFEKEQRAFRLEMGRKVSDERNGVYSLGHLNCEIRGKS